MKEAEEDKTKLRDLNSFNKKKQESSKNKKSRKNLIDWKRIED